MPWGSSERRSEQAERRLASIFRAGRADPAGPHHLPDSGPVDRVEPHRPDGRWTVGEWTRSGVRGLAVLAAVAIAVAGYWAWSGRPRAVAVAPAVVSTGTSVPGTSSPASAESATVLVEPGTPAGPTRTGADPTTPPMPDVVVHVIGLVARPGLVRLPPGSRVADAIERAGGVTRPRAAESVNLARVLVDGEQIVVAPAAALTPVTPGAVAAGSGIGASTGPLDLNSATAVALEALPGVGPVIAGRIVAWREENGPFRSIDELAEVAGIGEAIITQVRALLRV